MSHDPLVPSDPVAIAIKTHLLQLERKGHGAFKMEIENPGGHVLLSFGPLSLSAENCDVGLVRLAGLVLEDPKLGDAMLAAFRTGY